MGHRGEVFSDRLSAGNGKRTYFFNVKTNRSGDYFINLVESMKKFDDRFDRQEIIIYEEHIEEFRNKLDIAIDELHKARESSGGGQTRD